MTAILFLRSGFALTAATMLAAGSNRVIRNRFYTYGKTSSSPALPPCKASSILERFLDFTQSFSVPHGYFWHFYAVGIAANLFTAYQVVTHGAVYRLVASMTGDHRGSASMGVEQVLITWILVLAQVSRRLWECLYMQKPGSESRMWFVHYLAGLSFYTAISVAVWIEGTAAVDNFAFTPKRIFGLVNAPSIKTSLGVTVFTMASGAQHDAHAHLASLKKYSLPDHPLFSKVVCPHYTAEVLIYAALTVISAPKGQIVNKTLLAGLSFVVVNLGASAKINREWYERKFGKAAVKHKWSIIPGMF